ncbi:MAG TPA: tetratricopeptide repeat protein, partial [Methylomirabilota bacterium]
MSWRAFSRSRRPGSAISRAALVLPALALLLLVAARASAQPADPQSWESPMAAGDRAYQQGRYAEAERFFTSALERAERVGPQDPRVALSLGLLAAAYQAGGSYAPAEPLLQRALVIGETLLGPNHPEVASTLTALARLDTAQGRFAQADPFLRRALAIDERVLGPEHLEVAGTLDALASLERQQGRYTDAETRSRRAL